MVKKKLLHMNLFLMLAVLFAVSYQSIHTFSHEHHLKTECCDDSHHLTLKTSEKTVTESEDCPICDFKFVAFLSPEVLHFDFIPSFYEIPYQLRLKEIRSIFEAHPLLLLK
jgi:hypothetical protein